MRPFLFTVCLLAYSVTGAPQRGVQLGGPGGPRPVTFGSPQGGPTSQPNFGPSYQQQISFGPSDANGGLGVRGRGPAAYQTAQPILLQQGNPTGAPPSFSGFSSTPFPIGGPGRSPLSVRGPTTPSSADDEEYEEYEDEEEAPKSLQPTRGTPSPQRTPQRVSQPISFSQGPQRLVVQQQQPQQQVRQRQPQQTQQRQPIQQASPQFAQQGQRLEQSPGVRPGPGGQSYGLDGKRNRLTTPPPIQTLNRYMRQNDDGSITWGYENEDGSFKEETIGADCVVRGKYGYVDPDGQKREYEYQSGNPCDPNKKDQEEEEEELPEGPGPQQQLAGVLSARPRPQQQQQQQRRPVPQQQQYQPQYQ